MSVLQRSNSDISGLSYQAQRPKAPQLQVYSSGETRRFPNSTSTPNDPSPATESSHHRRNHSSTSNNASESESELATPPPDSPVIAPTKGYDIGYSSDEWEENESGLMQKKGKAIRLRRVKDPQASSAPDPLTPDQKARNEVFDHLAYCGFLDVKLAALYRWAANVVWDIQLYRQTHCPANHVLVADMPVYSNQKRTSKSRAKIPVPPVLYRLFAENALLPESIRTSATARALIVLHAVYYYSKTPVCNLCFCEAGLLKEQERAKETTTSEEETQGGEGEEEGPKFAILDLSKESKRSLGGVHESLVSRVVIDWAVAVRLSMAWLTDTPRGNYWEIHTKHIPDEIGASTTRYFQRVMNYRFAVTNARLLNIISLITDEHPLALTTPSKKRYNPKGGVYYENMPSMIRT
ncbi:hypothetical protein FRC17_004219 [Serendipita sp. 399]|nr:hypothetical protein FRC17_004219 [Serendipita sp. 399]